MKSNVSRLSSSVLLPLSMMVVFSAVSCAPAQWAEQAPVLSGEPSKNTKLPQKATYEFETRVVVESLPSRPLDIVWVVDNSNSMAAEAAHVRNNIQGFAKYVMTRAEVNFSLISRKGTSGTSVSLPTSTLASSFVHLDHYVWSTDSLEILAASMCAENPQAGTACEQIRVGARTAALAKVAGKLRPHLRASAKKIFVIVTDDESRISSDLFLSAFQEQFGGDTPAVFGFIGLGEDQSRCADKEGVQYLALARATSGEVFNVCDLDWSSKFRRLAEMSVRYSTHAIALPKEVVSGAQILGVEVNGSVLSPELYTVSREGLTLDLRILSSAAELSIKVKYEVTLP